MVKASTIKLVKCKISPKNLIFFVILFLAMAKKMIIEVLIKSITESLKKRSKLTKRYRNNLSSRNQEMMKCTTLIAEAKERYITNMSAKLVNLENEPKHIGQLSIDL